MNDTYEKLRAKVHSINYPDGIPLEFGCEVRLTKELKDWAKIVTFIGGNPKNGLSYFKELDGSIVSIRGLHQDNIQILGKPPSLQDILRAIGKSGWLYTLYQGGLLRARNYHNYDRCKTRKQAKISIDIDLSQKPQDWPEETLRSLLELL